MSVQSLAISSPVVSTAVSARRGLLAMLVNLLNRSAQVEAEQNAAERYYTSVVRGL